MYLLYQMVPQITKEEDLEDPLLVYCDVICPDARNQHTLHILLNRCPKHVVIHIQGERVAHGHSLGLHRHRRHKGEHLSGRPERAFGRTADN